MNDGIISIMQHSLENNVNTTALQNLLTNIIRKNKDRFGWVEISLVYGQNSNPIGVEFEYYKFSRKNKYYHNFKIVTTKDQRVVKYLSKVLNENLIDTSAFQNPQMQADFKEAGFESYKVLPPILVAKRYKGRIVFALQTNLALS